jgi:hypothetical protein
LKSLSDNYLESSKINFQHSSDISFPIGLSHLFWKNVHKDDEELSRLSSEQIEDGFLFLKQFTNGHFYSPNQSQTIFLITVNFNQKFFGSFYYFFRLFKMKRIEIL